MADTDILLGVDFDTSNVKKTAQEIQKDFEGVFKSGGDQGSPALSGLEQQVDRLSQKIDKLTEALQNVGNTNVSPSEESIQSLTGTIQQLNDFLVSLAEQPPVEPIDPEATEEAATVVEQQVQEMNQNVNEETIGSTAFLAGFIGGFVSGFVRSLVSFIINQVKKMINEIRKNVEDIISFVKKSLQTIGKMIVKMATTLTKSFLGVTIKSMQGTLGLVKALIDKLSSLKSVILENLKTMAKWNSGNNQVNKSLTQITSSLNYLKASLATAVAPLLNYIEPTLTRIIDKIAELITMLGMFLAKLTGAKGFQKAIKQQKDYAKAIGGTKDELAGFDELNILGDQDGAGVDFSEINLEDADFPEWLKNIEALKQKLYELGQLWGTKVKDWLNSIDWVKIKQDAKDAAEAISAFFKGLFDVDKLGASVGKAIGELTGVLTSFFNTLFTEMPWADIGTQLGELFSEAINTIPWDEIGELLKNAWNSLFTTLYNFFISFDGTDLGSGLTELLQNALEGIDWTLIKGTLVEAVHRLVETLRSLITPENFALLGTTLAETLNTVFKGIGTFAEDMSKKSKSGKSGWAQIGESIAVGITEAIKGFKAKDAAEAIGNLAMGLLDLILSAVEYLYDHLDEVTDKLIEFLESIPWEDLGGKVSEISGKLQTAFVKIFEALKDSGVLDQIIDFIATILNEQSTWEKLFRNVKFQLFWKVLWARLKEEWETEWEPIESWFKDLGKNIIEGIGAGFDLAIAPIRDAIRAIFEKILSIFEGPDAFDSHSPSKAMEPLGENIILGILEGFGLVDFAQKVTEWWDQNVQPWFDSIQENIDLLTGSITEKMTAFKDTMIDTFRAIKNGIKIPINYIIAFIEGMVNKIIFGLNWLIDKLNTVQFDIPDWVPEWGGNSFGINIPKLAPVEIPRLAQGAVIPPNKQFMAMLGDQTSGTNVEAPLATIQEALVGALEQIGFGGNEQPINIYLGTDKIYSEIRKLERRNTLMGG